jgi:hypothetical protein
MIHSNHAASQPAPASAVFSSPEKSEKYIVARFGFIW